MSKRNPRGDAPREEWPQEGGSYVRDPVTGRISKASAAPEPDAAVSPEAEVPAVSSEDQEG